MHDFQQQDDRKATPYPKRDADDMDEQFENDLDLIEEINEVQTSWKAKAYPEFEK